MRRLAKLKTNGDRKDKFAPPRLADVQRLVYRIIASPNGAAGAASGENREVYGSADEIVVSDDRLSAREHVDIYVNAYFYRLLEVLREDYPAVVTVTGDKTFCELIRSYLREYPSTEPSVFAVGRHLDDFLRNHPIRGSFPFLADLANLERTVLDVFHAADAVALDENQLRTIAVRDWPAMRLRLYPAARLLEHQWAIEELMRNVEQGSQWQPPEHRVTAMLVWRKASQVRYRALEADEYAALKLARTEASFAELCEKVAEHRDETGEAAATRTNRLLTRWISDGVLIQTA